MRFAAFGWRVEAVCPAGHPLRETASVARLHFYAALRPLPAVAAAIAAARPDLIVPCDDRAVAHLMAVQASAAAAGSPATQREIDPAEWPGAIERRSDLIRIAREAGVHAPEMRQVDGEDDLRAAIAAFGLPVVLKVDGSWGGQGVTVARTLEEAEQARRRLARRLDAARALKRTLFDRDPFHLLPWLTRTKPRVNVQAFISGRPATSAAACWDGDVLASIKAEALCTTDPVGASTVVRLIDHPDMALAEQRLARRLGLSGLHGFDFMIEHATGHAHLIELNPRATPIAHLALGPGRDPVGALVSRVEASAARAMPPVTENPVIAFFPQAWQSAPESPFLRTGYHDVPWADTGLMRDLVRLPYPDRSLPARLLARLRQPVRYPDQKAPGGVTRAPGAYPPVEHGPV